MARQPLFNQMPAALAFLAGTIVVAHIARIAMGLDLDNPAIQTFEIIPTQWEAALKIGGILQLFPSMFGHVFVHFDWLHLLFNMALFVSVGRALAERLDQTPGGSARFLIVFFGSAACAALAFVALNRGSSNPALGASGAVCGIYAAYLMAVRGDWRRSLRDPLVLQNGAVFLALNVGLAFAARQLGVLPIAWEAHLGGFVGGMVIYALIAPPPYAERQEF